MTNLCWATNLLGEVWRHVTMVAKFLDLKIFLDGDGHLHCWTTEEKYGLPFCSWVQSCTGKSYMSVFSFFFLLYLQDYGLLRTRNFLPWQRDVTTTLHPLRIHSSGSSVFLEELFGNQDRYNLLTCNDTNHSGSQKKSISVISSQG